MYVPTYLSIFLSRLYIYCLSILTGTYSVCRDLELEETWYFISRINSKDLTTIKPKQLKKRHILAVHVTFYQSSLGPEMVEMWSSWRERSTLFIFTEVYNGYTKDNPPCFNGGQLLVTQFTRDHGRKKNELTNEDFPEIVSQTV